MGQIKGVPNRPKPPTPKKRPPHLRGVIIQAKGDYDAIGHHQHCKRSRDDTLFPSVKPLFAWGTSKTKKPK